MSDNFYKAFEDKHRGSRELIKSRLQHYLPFINPLKKCYKTSQTIDLGCGRGEWLELLVDNGGFDAHGVDLDSGMLQVCETYKLQYKQQDALTCLKNLDNESQTIVSGFHLAEHIAFEDLQELIQQALRVLKPAGLLILETPNPENIAVGTADFYMDPTHNQPIPPYLLSFIPEFYGFNRTKIVRLQEDKDLIKNDRITLLEVLKGVSPDYAIIAQKDGPNEMMSLFKSAFKKEYGVSLELLAGNFDRQSQGKSERVEQQLTEITTRAGEAEARTQATTQAAEARIQTAEMKTQAAEAKTQAAEAKAQEAFERLALLIDSKSWKYTAPLRQGIAFAKRIVSRLRR